MGPLLIRFGPAVEPKVRTDCDEHIFDRRERRNIAPDVGHRKSHLHLDNRRVRFASGANVYMAGCGRSIVVDQVVQLG
jgi:hypothetical protein